MAERGPRSEAIAWHLQLREGAAADWDDFVAWLEQDPAHSAAYDEVAAIDEGFGPSAPVAPAAANDDQPTPGRRLRWRVWGPAAAAGLAGLLWLGYSSLSDAPGADRYEIATAAGEQSTVAIADGSRAELNGSTRLVLDHGDPRYAELAAGEATFTIRHDPARPFTLAVGGHRIQDVGTTFNVVRDRGRFAVEVIEGAVLVDPERSRVSLTAGQSLAAERDGPATLSRRDPEAMAGWRRGQLSFRAAPLERVAGDLSRSLGAEIALDPSLRARPFTGSIRIGGDPAATVGGFASTLGLRARHVARGWLIEPQARAPR